MQRNGVRVGREGKEPVTTTAYALAGIEQADPQHLEDLINARFPENFEGDVTFYLPKAGTNNHDVMRKVLTALFGKSGVRSVVNPMTSVAKAKGILLVVPGGDVMEIAREARDKGVQVLDLRTGNTLVLAGEIAPLPEVSPDLADLSYEELVELGRSLTSGYQWRLALLSQAVEVGWGVLQQYADDIGVNYQTLRTIRSVYNAWKDCPGFAGIPFGVAKALMAHDDREKLLAKHPDMTVREAEQYAGARRAALSARDEEAESKQSAEPVKSKPPSPAPAEEPAPAEDPADDADDVISGVIVEPEGSDDQDSANSASSDSGAVQGLTTAQQDVLNACARLSAVADKAIASGLDGEGALNLALTMLSLAEQIEAALG
jgi:hypothetical protein